MSDVAFDLTKHVWGKESHNGSSIGLLNAMVIFLVVCHMQYLLELLVWDAQAETLVKRIFVENKRVLLRVHEFVKRSRPA